LIKGIYGVTRSFIDISQILDSPSSIQENDAVRHRGIEEIHARIDISDNLMVSKPVASAYTSYVISPVILDLHITTSSGLRKKKRGVVKANYWGKEAEKARKRLLCEVLFSIH